MQSTFSLDLLCFRSISVNLYVTAFWHGISVRSCRWQLSR